jgi:hypothetical protein
MHRTGRKAQGLEAGTKENLVAILVVSRLLQRFVMRAVDLHEQSPAQTKKIGEVAEQGRLPAKVEALRP